MDGATDDHKAGIAKWFLLRSPPGQIQQVAKDVQKILMSDKLYQQAASEAFPIYNMEQMICLELPDGSGQVLVSNCGALDSTHYLDLRTAQVATVDHIKQICTKIRPATDEELPSGFVEEYRSAIDSELLKYVEEAFPRGSCAVFCTAGSTAEEDDAPFELTALISASKISHQNFSSGSWRSTWKIQVNQELQSVDLTGKVHVNAHYFEEGNVQLDTNYEGSDSTVLQNPLDVATAVVNIIRSKESEYLLSLEESYSKLSDNTFKELRRKLPVTRTLFAWNNALQLSLSREVTRELSKSS
ncbi:F-actin-capping protein subunit alpha isoform X2 [Selaginella moellendorffii]|uniref:F-actin-capping protein subunit alpha isoform X2 n=1 Tax=Selaginella moellendorffii TaxID=88036 RepID=UPI000D1CFE8D|nr:F-actin-capping protein subunit alpha isoform X2 [Selaginella moellendorffii]|eukprot:XP_024543271.1 F-actin-capping protein subunit alpha isoform X2 [Selaginella moellendorffii]